ncbi:MAG: PKD domain-containing protein, partial [Flavobacteriales bacterium]
MNKSVSKYTVRLIFVISLLITNVYTLFAQCPVTAFASSTTINCGDTVTLSALAGGCTPLNNNFNSGNIGTDWSASPGGVVTDGTGTYACAGPPSEGSHYLWMGATVAAPRGVVTNNYDLTDCGAIGATICFDMKYSTQAGPDPCEGIDLPAEGVSVQYSTNGGATWTTIQYYDPNGGYDPMLTSWNRYCLAVPSAALTTSTMFRWYQSQSSGAGFDTWGLDDMVITLTVPGYTYDWTHDIQGVQPTPATPNVAPTTTTTYTVTYTNGVETCSSPVTVNVLLPTVTTTASPTTFCSGASSQLIASSSLISTPPQSCGINTYVGCPPNSQAGEPQIGNGATVASYNSSANYVFGDFGSTGGVRTQIIYRASELIAAGFSAGQITNMQLEVAAIQTGSSTTTGSAIYNNFTIQLACIAANQFSSSSNWQSGLTTVFPATNVNVTPGWNTFNFPNSYNWDGTSNIVVQLCWYNGSSGGNPAKTKTQASGFNSMISSYVNASGAALNCASHTSFQTLYTFRPNTRFGTCTPKNLPLIYSWTPTTGLSNPNIYNPVATPTSTTTYTVTVQQSGAPAACNATSNVTVNVVAPTVSISNVCSGGVATLTANGTTNGTVPSGTITNSNTSAQANYNVNTYVEKCIDVSNINPNTYPSGLANVFVNITHCDIAEVDIQIMGPGGVWTTLTALTSGGKTWTTLPAGAATSINGQWCIRYKDNCVGCGIAGIDDCGGLNFNSWSITVNNAAGSNQIVEYTWSPSTNLNTTTGAVVQSTSTSPTTYTVTVKDAFGCTANQMITVDASNCIQQPPTASFTTSSNTICIGENITFTDNSTGTNINSWNWTFNGGTPNTANTQGAHTVTFNTAGTFNITLQVTDDNGTDDTTMTVTVNPAATGTDVQTACNSYTWIDGNNYTTSTNTPTYTIVGGSSEGCDSIVTLNLTINTFASGTDVQTECNSY